MLRDRNDLLENKKIEIFTVIKRTGDSLGEEENISSREILQSMITSGGLWITAPQEEPPMMSFLTIDSLRNYNKGESIKPGNIRLNMRKLIESLPDLAGSLEALEKNGIFWKVCAALNIWKELLKITTVEITKEQAIAIVALWENCNEQQEISLDKGYECFKLFYNNIEGTDCTWEQYMRLIHELEIIGSLKLDDDGIWLCEWVSINYYQ